jgi:membrane-bound serine protease (ClpP class)
MKTSLRIILFFLILLSALFAMAQERGGAVYLIDFNDMVHGVSADLVGQGIDKAEAAGAELVIIQMQTPGGLVSSMEQIIQRILASRIPVVGYVSPGGAKAASAGFYILMACDVAVMAPGTRTGAATPIMMGGGGEGDNETFKTLMEKVKGDSRAFLRSLIHGRMRNAAVPRELTTQKAIEAIDLSAAYSEQEALEFGMIDFIAADVDELLAQLNGKEIHRFAVEGGAPRTVRVTTAGARIERVEMDLRQQFLSYLSNPMIALLLGSIGLIGLYIEFSNPGMIFPGAIGAVCLVLAAIAFQILSVNWAGLLIILIAIALFVLELKIPSFGLLTFGGIICLIIGGMILFEGPIPEMRIGFWQMLPFALTFALISIFLLRLVIKAHLGKVATGNPGLVGAVGLMRGGKIFVRGEIWNVAAAESYAEGDQVIVEKVDGLVLHVRKVV